MTTFEREYRELDRLKGVSLKDNVLLYKITPEIVPYEELPESLKDMAARYYWAPPPQAKKPWKLRLAIFLGVLSWFWFELVKYLGWFS